MTYTEAASRIAELERTLHAYRHAMSVLNYDAETVAPVKSAAMRGETMGVLAGEEHHLLTSPETAEIIETILSAPEADPVNHRKAEILKETVDELCRIPAKEYAEYSALVTEASIAWHGAKRGNDYAAFKPYLARIVESNIRFAGYKDASRKPYDVILDGYEKGMTMEKLDGFFGLLQRELTPVILRVKDAPQPDDSFLHVLYPAAGQKQLAHEVMQLMGIDPERCVLGETEHPFTDGTSRDDVRITTHYHEHDAASSLFSVIHEGGHALYELGVDPLYDGTLLGGGSSMGIHESQSRFYENLIGRSLPFCKALLPRMKKVFPGQLTGVTAEMLWKALNRAEPGLIRTEADELTYPMHVMVRYELEKQLIAGTLTVDDLPAAWNEMYKRYLGVTVPDDTHGVLQDSHWAGGAIGYFPSYALGSAYGAQMLPRMETDIPDLWQKVEAGELAPVTGWLGEKIHHYGQFLTSAQLQENACGGAFDPDWYVRYLKNKYSALYGV